MAVGGAVERCLWRGIFGQPRRSVAPGVEDAHDGVVLDAARPVHTVEPTRHLGPGVRHDPVNTLSDSRFEKKTQGVGSRENGTSWQPARSA